MPIHTGNLQILTTEIFKVSMDLTPTIFSEIPLERSVQYNLRHTSDFSSKREKYFLWYKKFVLSRIKNLGFSSRGAQ